MKKIIALGLVLVMVCSVFVGCGLDLYDYDYEVSDYYDDEEIDTVKPNSWYHNDNFPGVNFKNCLVANAFSSSGGKYMTVVYYSVCQFCHEMAGVQRMAAVGYSEPYNFIYTCPDCLKPTTVVIQLS